MSPRRSAGGKLKPASGGKPTGDGGPTGLYGHRYYEQYRVGTDAGFMAYERSDHWLRFFGAIADHIVTDIKPQSVLDAGCAMGFLVEALRDRGVEAYGIDVSEYAISQVREDIKPYCSQGSVTDRLTRSFDLVVSIEVLEHLKTEEAIAAVNNLCSATSDFIFSSTPQDYDEPTHFNVRPSEWWAEVFARQGFFRDVDYDPSTYISPWAVRYRRSHDSVARTVSGYERLTWRLKTENLALREGALEQRSQLERYERIEAELAAIKRSRSWRFANAPTELAKRLFPYDTSRGRWLRSLVGRQPKS